MCVFSRLCVCVCKNMQSFINGGGNWCECSSSLSTPFAPLHLVILPSFSPPSLLSSFPFALPYIVLAISQSHQWLLFFNKWRRSRARWGKEDGGRVNTERPFISFSLYSVSLMFPFPRSLSLSPPPNPPTPLSMSVSQEIALKAGCMLNGLGAASLCL